MKTDKEVLELAFYWFKHIDEMGSRVSSGNVTHNIATIRANARHNAEFIRKHLTPTNQ